MGYASWGRIVAMGELIMSDSVQEYFDAASTVRQSISQWTREQLDEWYLENVGYRLSEDDEMAATDISYHRNAIGEMMCLLSYGEGAIHTAFLLQAGTHRKVAVCDIALAVKAGYTTDHLMHATEEDVDAQCSGDYVAVKGWRHLRLPGVYEWSIMTKEATARNMKFAVLMAEVKKQLRMLGWSCYRSQGDGPAIARRTFKTATVDHECLIYFYESSIADVNHRIAGTYESEGRNILESKSVLIPRNVDIDRLESLVKKFSDDAIKAIDNSYARKLLLSK